MPSLGQKNLELFLGINKNHTALPGRVERAECVCVCVCVCVCACFFSCLQLKIILTSKWHILGRHILNPTQQLQTSIFISWKAGVRLTCIYSASQGSRLMVLDFHLKDAGVTNITQHQVLRWKQRPSAVCGSLLAASANLTKSFSFINWVAMWETLWNRGCSEGCVNHNCSAHEGMMVRPEGLEKRSDVVTVTKDIKWGCDLAPLLFIIHFQSYSCCFQRRCGNY